MYPLTSGGRPFIKLLSLPHTVQEPSSESSWATHGHSTDHLILMACFMSWTVRQPHTPYIHCHAITHFYSHINFLHLDRILTYALLFNLSSSTYHLARSIPQLCLVIAHLCPSSEQTSCTNVLSWAGLSPSVLTDVTLPSLNLHSYHPSSCSHLELGFVEVSCSDLAKDVVDPPSLDNERAKEEGESQRGCPDGDLDRTLRGKYVHHHSPSLGQ